MFTFLYVLHLLTLKQVGDVVIVHPGEDAHRSRAEHASFICGRSISNLATQKWSVGYSLSYLFCLTYLCFRFCKINYFYEKPSPKQHEKLFHAQWLQQGPQTFLQEAAHSRALFWLHECDDLPVECIYSHCNLQPWPLGEAEPLEDIDGPENHFFTGYILWLLIMNFY